MKKLYPFLLLVILAGFACAQATLKPSIGLSSLPADNTPICNPTCSSSYNFNTDGLQVGDTIPDFTFYTLSGTPYNAQTLINSGKPLCLVAGSYTCPVWRGKITTLNTLISTYGSQVNFLVVYVCEAHPESPDISPYSCSVWNPNPPSVAYLQPTTYGGRKTVLTDMVNNTCSCVTTVNCPIVIDGPCNQYWAKFGPAPNNAYLIRPDKGTVFCKHGWFNQVPNDMGACIDSLLTIMGVKNLQAEIKADVYPNPASGRVTFSVSGFGSSYNISIFDIAGQKVRAISSLSQPSFELETAELNGVYFFRIESPEHLFNGKLIIQK